MVEDWSSKLELTGELESPHGHEAWKLLREALSKEGYKDARFRTWFAKSTAKKSTEEDIRRNTKRLDALEKATREECERRGFEFTGLARDNGSVADGSGAVLFFPPNHADPYVATLLCFTTRCLREKGLSGNRDGGVFITDVYPLKIAGSAFHRDLPCWEAVPNFQLREKSREGQKVIYDLCAKKNQEDILERAVTPTFTVVEGLFPHKKLHADLKKLDKSRYKLHYMDVPFRVPTLPGYEKVEKHGSSLGCYVISDLKTEEMLGVFLLCAHGSQGKYARYNRNLQLYIDGVGSDFAKNLLSSHANYSKARKVENPNVIANLKQGWQSLYAGHCLPSKTPNSERMWGFRVVVRLRAHEIELFVRGGCKETDVKKLFRYDRLYIEENLPSLLKWAEDNNCEPFLRDAEVGEDGLQKDLRDPKKKTDNNGNVRDERSYLVNMMSLYQVNKQALRTPAQKKAAADKNRASQNPSLLNTQADTFRRSRGRFGIPSTRPPRMREVSSSS